MSFPFSFYWVPEGKDQDILKSYWVPKGKFIHLQQKGPQSFSSKRTKLSGLRCDWWTEQECVYSTGMNGMHFEFLVLFLQSWSLLLMAMLWTSIEVKKSQGLSRWRKILGNNTVMREKKKEKWKKAPCPSLLKPLSPDTWNLNLDKCNCSKQKKYMNREGRV